MEFRRVLFRSLRVVRAVNEAHELAHYIAVEPGWAKRVLSHQPARGKDDKIAIRDSRNSAGTGQDREDTGIGMVETDRPNGVESAEIIFVWNEIAMPGDNVQRRMIQRHCPEQPLKLLHDLRRFVAVLIPCPRRFEPASVGKANGPDGAKLRQTKGLAIILEYITAKNRRAS